MDDGMCLCGGLVRMCFFERKVWLFKCGVGVFCYGGVCGWVFCRDFGDFDIDCVDIGVL